MLTMLAIPSSYGQRPGHRPQPSSLSFFASPVRGTANPYIKEDR